MVFQNDILAGASGTAAGYTINQSIRFNDDDSAYLSRTFGTPTDATNWTFSAWVKRCNLGTEQFLFNSGASAAAYYIRFETTDKIRFRASTSWDITTTEVFRDISAWYHIVATFENGAVTLYINNDSIATASVSDSTYNFFTNIIHSIGGSTIGGSNCDLYLAEAYGIDGQALDPTNFGEYNDDGVWIPKQYAGTYGNNGFYLKGQDSAALGDDSSGNGNDFTSSGLTSDDQVSDSPTDNFCVLNPIDPATTGTLSNGNLVTTGNATVTIRPETGQWYYEKDGVGVSYDADTSGPFNPTLTSGAYNFGQLPWTDSGPTGAEKALSTANLPGPTIADGSAYFQTTLYTGTGAGDLEVNQIENSTFQPDLVWIKQRNKTDNHVLTDAVRGAPAALYSNSTAAEVVGTGGITSLDPDGFTLSGDGSVWNNVNQSGITAAAWQWLAGNGTASNTDGSITTTVSANTTAGFSIISYTGNTTSGATIGHGLGVAPALVITKERTTGSYNWYVYHQSNGATKYMRLNDSNSVFTDSAAWNNTAPTSSVITLGNASSTNNSSTMIAYAFAEVEGFSKFGSYTGNGSADGPFVWCGFRPALIIGKNASAAENWWIYDTARSTFNVADEYLSPNLTSTESTAAWFDINSNGFKVRDNGNAPNGSGNTIIFMAFAEHPFGGNGVAPVPAR